MTARIREQVLELADRRVTPAAIAHQLCVTMSRVEAILDADAETAGAPLPEHTHAAAMEPAVATRHDDAKPLLPSGSTRRPARCGTKPGARRHRRLGEPVCEECKQAERDAVAEYRERKRGRPVIKREPAKCGTPSGWVKHRRRGETPCEACVTAAREDWKVRGRAKRAAS